MTDNSELIKKAVEYADGFDITEGQFTFPSGHYFNISPAFTGGEPQIKGWMLDALAAQLVRQIDATEHWFESRDDGEAVIWHRDGSGKVTKASEPFDRTMNTLTACVEFYEGQDNDR